MGDISPESKPGLTIDEMIAIFPFLSILKNENIDTLNTPYNQLLEQAFLDLTRVSEETGNNMHYLDLCAKHYTQLIAYWAQIIKTGLEEFVTKNGTDISTLSSIDYTQEEGEVREDVSIQLSEGVMGFPDYSLTVHRYRGEEHDQAHFSFLFQEGSFELYDQFQPHTLTSNISQPDSNTSHIEYKASLRQGLVTGISQQKDEQNTDNPMLSPLQITTSLLLPASWSLRQRENM